MTALVWRPFPDRDVARSSAATLLEENLIGCANILGDIESMFVWDGEKREATAQSTKAWLAGVLAKGVMR